MKKVIFVLAILIMGGWIGRLWPVSAQTPPEDWSPPINLSLSGSTENPVVVMDHTGILHVVWLDEFSGSMYAKYADGQWSAPVHIKFPFDGTVPRFVIDAAGKIHAFWLGVDNFEGILYYSSVNAKDFGTTQWAPTRQLSDSAASFDAVVGPDNILHLTYLRAVDSAQLTAGVYYLQKAPNFDRWTAPVPLYKSPYLRLLTSEDAKVSTVLHDGGENENILFSFWENPPRKKIQMARSEDNGKTWSEPVDIANPETEDSEITPKDANFIIFSDKLLVVWKNMLTANRCQQVYQLYSLDGEKQTGPSPMLQELFGCPQNDQLLPISDEFVALITRVFDKVYLLAWDGEKWSAPQVQVGLSNLVDPETLQPIDLGCYQPILSDDLLALIGCDQNDGDDIWVTSRTLEVNSTWFAPRSSWNEPEIVVTDAGNIGPISIVADPAGEFHAVWAQSDGVARDHFSLYYARWSEAKWAYIKSVIQPPLGKVNTLAAAIDSNSRLYLVWSGGDAGEIYFSWATASKAWNPKEWLKPEVLPMPRLVGNSASLYINENNTLNVVYTVPINEARGVYLIQSRDGGVTWTEPKMVLNGQAEGWEIVDQAELIGVSNAQLFILAKRTFPLDGSGQGAFYYLRSTDNGASWSSPARLSEVNLLWSQMLASPQGVLYRVWQETQSGNTITWLDYSGDGGATWSEPTNFSGRETTIGTTDLVMDASGQLHLLQLMIENNELLLREWIWDGAQWRVGEDEALGAGVIRDVTRNLVTGLDARAFLGVLITGPIATGTDTAMGIAAMGIVFTGRQLEATPGEVQTPLPPVPTAETYLTPSPTDTPSAEIESTPTPRQPGSDTEAQNPGLLSLNGISSEILGPAIGLVAAALIIVITFVIFQSLAKRNQ